MCSALAGSQLAPVVEAAAAQIAGLRLGRSFSIRDIIKWCRRMQVSPELHLWIHCWSASTHPEGPYMIRLQVKQQTN